MAVVTNGYNSNSKQFLKSQKDLNAIQKSLYEKIGILQYCLSFVKSVSLLKDVFNLKIPIHKSHKSEVWARGHQARSPAIRLPLIPCSGLSITSENS